MPLDYYFAAGEGDRRRWADMVRHGFVSAGGGRWYVVRVRWLVTFEREDAFWIPGLYANENSVTRMRDSWTLERLCEAFGVD